ncbi:Glucose-insensitive transcription protein [Lachnellula suecica]|uniref:Glucose-insensitive transcription protein n=1 Tax=Lachnellula suecica TaxID=602035 RepID=A0A8T9CBD6_9HELO|nr:Glucose-insensitive transcription protein [Lachnellula suecica]
MATEAHSGQEALEARDYPAAIKHLTKAIKATSGIISPLWLIQRSTAYQRSGEYAKALKDADWAHYSATQRGRRELIASAHFRRAIAYHGLGQFGNARMCFHWSGKYNDKEKGLTMWVAKNTMDFEKAGGNEAECNIVTAVMEPPFNPVESKDIKGKGKMSVVEEPAMSKDKAPAVQEPADIKGKAPAVQKPAPSNGKEPEAAVVAKPAGTTIDKIRMDWYQSNTTVTIDILCKGIPKENTTVTFTNTSLEVKFPVPASNCDYEYKADPLNQGITAHGCTYRVTPHKLEIVLEKSFAHIKWSGIKREPQSDAKPQTNAEDKSPSSVQASADPQPQASKPEKMEAETPSKPTDLSANTRFHKDIVPREDLRHPEPILRDDFSKKNWDKVLADEDDEEVGGDEMNAFFKKIYKGADPDTQRAMMKSYQESNGTALSTNWSEVEAKKYDVAPPEGMEVKKWD